MVCAVKTKRENSPKEMKTKLLNELSKYPLSDFFLRKSVEAMSEKQIADDLATEYDLSLLRHFDEPDQMRRLEDIFAKTMKTFGLSREELKGRAEFNFDIYEPRNFESQRGVFRFANALCKEGFKDFVLLGPGLADFMTKKDGQLWFVEVKTLVLQTKPQEFEVDGVRETFTVDKFQPESRNSADYVETVSSLVAIKHMEEARGQLRRTVEKMGPGNKMAAIVVNLFAADCFLDAGNLGQVEARLHGKSGGKWQINYLADIDALSFLTNQLYLFPST